MESVVSLLVFTLLMLAVTTMIQTSLKMTSIFTEEAKDAQDKLNLVVLSDPGSGGETANITITVDDLGIVADHTVIINKSESGGEDEGEGGEILAFTPKPDPGDEP